MTAASLGLDVDMADLAARYRPLAFVRSWEDFRLAFRARCDELAVSRATVDAVGGLPAGQTSKLLAPVRDQGFGPMSLHALVGALGLAILVVEDTDAIERIRARLTPRNAGMVRANGRHASGKKRRKANVFTGNSEWGRVMAARRTVLVSPAKRKRSAQIAARARWGKAIAKLRKDPKLMKPIVLAPSSRQMAAPKGRKTGADLKNRPTRAGVY